MEVWVRYPLVDAPRLEGALGALEQTLGRELRTAKERRKRGDVLFAARHNEEALAAYERALAEGLSGSSARSLPDLGVLTQGAKGKGGVWLVGGEALSQAYHAR